MRQIYYDCLQLIDSYSEYYLDFEYSRVSSGKKYG